MLDSRPRGRGFEPHRRHCVVSLSKNINPSLVLVQPRKTRPFITVRLLMGRKESNQTNKTKKEMEKWLIRTSVQCILAAPSCSCMRFNVHVGTPLTSIVDLSFIVFTCWERADLYAFLYGTFSSAFVTFPQGVSGQVWYLIVSTPDICLLPYCFTHTSTDSQEIAYTMLSSQNI